MNYLHRREDITPGIREGYHASIVIGGIDASIV